MSTIISWPCEEIGITENRHHVYWKGHKLTNEIILVLAEKLKKNSEKIANTSIKTTLKIADWNIPEDVDLKPLTEVLLTLNLEEVSIIYSSIALNQFHLLCKALSKCETIGSFEFTSNLMTSKDFSAKEDCLTQFCTLLEKNPNLTYFDATDNLFNNRVIPLLSSFPYWKRDTILSLLKIATGIPISDQKETKDTIEQPKATSDNAPDEDEIMLSPLNHYVVLKKRFFYTHEDILALAEKLKKNVGKIASTSIETILTIDSFFIPDDINIQPLIDVLLSLKLKEVQITGSRLSINHFYRFCKAFSQCKKLYTLDFSNNLIVSEKASSEECFFIALAMLKANPSLKYLDLSENRSNDVAIRELEVFSGNVHQDKIQSKLIEILRKRNPKLAIPSTSPTVTILKKEHEKAFFEKQAGIPLLDRLNLPILSPLQQEFNRLQEKTNSIIFANNDNKMNFEEHYAAFMPTITQADKIMMDACGHHFGLRGLKKDLVHALTIYSRMQKQIKKESELYNVILFFKKYCVIELHFESRRKSTVENAYHLAQAYHTLVHSHRILKDFSEMVAAYDTLSHYQRLLEDMKRIAKNYNKFLDSDLYEMAYIDNLYIVNHSSRTIENIFSLLCLSIDNPDSKKMLGRLIHLTLDEINQGYKLIDQMEGCVDFCIARFYHYCDPNLKIAQYDFERALQYYELSAKQGFVHAQYELGCIYKFGIRGIKRDFIKAIAFFDLAASQKHPDALYERGIYWHQSGNIEVALSNLTEAAEQFHPESLYYLGNLHLQGALKEGINQEKAHAFFKEAAGRGHLKAQLEMAQLLHTKDHVKEAMEYYRLAADQNHADSMLTLAKLYENYDLAEHSDPKVDQDFHKAQQYYGRYHAIHPGNETISKKLTELEAVFLNQSQIADTFKSMGLDDMAPFRGLFAEYELPSEPLPPKLLPEKPTKKPKKDQGCLIM